MEMQFLCITFLLIVGSVFIRLAKGSVTVFSVYDVLVEMDTFGLVTISRTNMSEWSYQGQKENNEVFLKVNEVRLLNRDGVIVTTLHLLTSKVPHFVETNFQDNQYTGLGANGRGMQVISLGDAKGALELKFFIFTEPGTIHPEVAPEKVNYGDVRVDVIVRDLNIICANCTDIAALEVLMDINGKEDEDIKTKLENNNIDTISISNGAKFVLSDKLSLDGKWDTMPQGFPQLEAMEKYVEVTLRFPTFTEKAVYGLTVKPLKLGESINENKISTKDKRQSDPHADNSNVVPSVSMFLLFLAVVCSI